MSNNYSLECEKCIIEKESFEALKSMPNDKSSGNVGLTKELVETFKCEVKTPSFSHSLHSLCKGERCTSQGKTIIKLIEKIQRQKMNSKLETNSSTKYWRKNSFQSFRQTSQENIREKTWSFTWTYPLIPIELKIS